MEEDCNVFPWLKTIKKGKESGYWENRMHMCLAKEFLKEENKKKYFFISIPKGMSVYKMTEYILS